MHDDFNAYRAELDRLRLTDESKQALTASLARRQSNPARSSPRRLPGTLRLAGHRGGDLPAGYGWLRRHHQRADAAGQRVRWRRGV